MPAVGFWIYRAWPLTCVEIFSACFANSAVNETSVF